MGTSTSWKSANDTGHCLGKAKPWNTNVFVKLLQLFPRSDKECRRPSVSFQQRRNFFPNRVHLQLPQKGPTAVYVDQLFFLFKYALVHHAVVGLIKKEQRFFSHADVRIYTFPTYISRTLVSTRNTFLFITGERKRSDPPHLHLHSSVKPWTWIDINNVFAVSNTYESGLFSCFQKWPLKGVYTNSQRIV